MTGSRKYNFKCQSFPNTIEQERRRRIAELLEAVAL